jgi:hypothetical protein
MKNNPWVPPHRDLPPGRLEQRKAHLLAEISRLPDAKPSPLWSVSHSRRRIVIALTATALGVASAVVVGIELNGTSARSPQAGGPGASMGASHTSAPLKTIVTSADISKIYRDVPQLTRDAQAIVRGKVVGISYIDGEADSALQTYTKVLFRVSQSLKGDASPGSTVVFIELGGVTSAAKIAETSDIPPSVTSSESSSAQVQVLFEGAPLPRVGDEIVYFGARGDIGALAGNPEVPETYYQPVGAFQGAFSVVNGTAERYVPSALLSAGLDPLRMPVSALDTAIAKSPSS